MEISIYAYGKNLDPHRIFKGKLQKEDIKDWPAPSSFNGKAHCSPIVLDNKIVENTQYVFLNEKGEFEPGVQINVAAEMILHGKYRVYQKFDKDELVLMLASIINKSDMPEITAKLESLIKE